VRQLVDHVESYLIPRGRSLDAPLVVVLVGPTGAGKSTLMNALVGSSVSRTGVLRPTTREAVLVADADDARFLMTDGALARTPRERLELVSEGGRAGLALIDAPDIDSIERDNRALADGLVEAADLCIFVTTATRYADQVPWDVLRRVQERGLPLMVVVNRLPASEADADSVVEDVRRLLSGAGFDALGEGERLTIVPVREGDLDASGEQLGRAAVEPVLRRLAALAGDRDARRALAARALAGALAGTGPLMHAVADDLEHEAIDADAVRRAAETLYAEELRALHDELRGGRFLREEVLRQWLSYVGADQVTRFFSSGIGRLRGSVLALFRGTPSAPVAAVEEEATSDLAALTLAHLADAARRTAARWSEMPHGAGAIAADDRLWSVAPDAASALETRFSDWVVGIASDVQATGGPKRALARGASIGVNTVGVGVMLSVFAHTGGLTGAEVGVAAATAFLNQKLLNALFGEAAVVEMVDRARRRLAELLTEAFAEDRGRFDRLVPSAAELRELAGELRALEGRIRGASAAFSA
jgi:energy-coupling factor transporter ATP-binding protein EcfA2